MTPSRYAFYLLLTLLALPVQADFPLAPLKGVELQETLNREAPVSGRVVAGALVYSDDIGTDLFVKPVAAAGTVPDDVCVKVVSRDGLYWSENSFSWPADGSRMVPVRLQYNSRYHRELAAYGANELAVLTSMGDCSDPAQGPVILTTRSVVPERSGRVDIFINSGRSDSFLVYEMPGNERMTRPCHLIREGRRTGFDTVCSLPAEDLAQLGTSVDVRVVRRRYDRMLPATTLTLMLPERSLQ